MWTRPPAMGREGVLAVRQKKHVYAMDPYPQWLRQRGAPRARAPPY